MTTELGPEVEILPPEDPSERSRFQMADHEREWLAAARAGPRAGKARGTRRPRLRGLLRGRGRGLVLVVVGAVAAFAGWQVSYGYPAREAIASLSPTLRWIVPEAPAPAGAEQNGRIDEIARSIDRMAAELAANQSRVALLAAGQEKITHEISKLKGLVQSSSSSSRRPQPHALYYDYYR